MTVRVTEDAIGLVGRCLVEDAEALLTAIQQNPELPVDVSGLQRLHMAVAQVLMVLKPRIAGDPADTFLIEHVFRRNFDGDKAPKTN